MAKNPIKIYLNAIISCKNQISHLNYTNLQFKTLQPPPNLYLVAPKSPKNLKSPYKHIPIHGPFKFHYSETTLRGRLQLSFISHNPLNKRVVLVCHNSARRRKTTSVLFKMDGHVTVIIHYFCRFY